jgi:hypothetical protein
LIEAFKCTRAVYNGALVAYGPLENDILNMLLANPDLVPSTNLISFSCQKGGKKREGWLECVLAIEIDELVR